MDTKKTGDVLVLGLPFEFIVASENRSDRFRNKTDWNETLREVWGQCGTNEARNITLNCAMLKNTPSNTDCKLKTCSFQHCLRWAKLISHPKLSNNNGEKLTSKHHAGDWNTLGFFLSNGVGREDPVQQHCVPASVMEAFRGRQHKIAQADSWAQERFAQRNVSGRVF